MITALASLTAFVLGVWISGIASRLVTRLRGAVQEYKDTRSTALSADHSCMCIRQQLADIEQKIGRQNAQIDTLNSARSLWFEHSTRLSERVKSLEEASPGRKSGRGI